MTREGVRNIDGYNSKHKLPMPYIVVVVDEMSDLVVQEKELKIIFKNYLKWHVPRNSYYYGHSKTKV